MQKISFNGKEYDSLDEMPLAERRAYEQLLSIFVDKDQNGVPDILEGDIVRNILKASTATVIVDGQPVSSLESLPPEARARYERGMKTLQALGLIPQAPSTPPPGPAPQWDASDSIRPSAPLIPTSSVHQEDRAPRAVILVIILLILLIGLAGVAFFLLAR
jgi:hypothetical protein